MYVDPPIVMFCTLCHEKYRDGEDLCPECGDQLVDYDNLCEAAYEERYSGEPPVSLDEQHRAAWEQKQALRAGRNI